MTFQPIIAGPNAEAFERLGDELLAVVVIAAVIVVASGFVLLALTKWFK